MEPKFWQLDVLDDYMQSWFVWEYKAYTAITGVIADYWRDSGEPIRDNDLAYSRTYAQAIQGRVVNYGMRHHHLNSSFILRYRADPGIAAPTEIRLSPKLWYPRGYRVRITPPKAATWQLGPNSTNLLLVELQRDFVRKGDVVTVNIDAL